MNLSKRYLTCRAAPQASGRGGAAYTITEECERLFCETLRAVFRVERKAVVQNSLVLGAYEKNVKVNQSVVERATAPFGEPLPSDGSRKPRIRSSIAEWVEVHDCGGEALFRGFTCYDMARRKALFVFFDEGLVRKDLKHGLMALIELANTPTIRCEQLVLCLDRQADISLSHRLDRDLRHVVGFELITLEQWAGIANVTSEKWIFYGMDVE